MIGAINVFQGKKHHNLTGLITFSVIDMFLTYSTCMCYKIIITLYKKVDKQHKKIISLWARPPFFIPQSKLFNLYCSTCEPVCRLLRSSHMTSDLWHNGSPRYTCIHYSHSHSQSAHLVRDPSNSLNYLLLCGTFSYRSFIDKEKYPS